MMARQYFSLKVFLCLSLAGCGVTDKISMRKGASSKGSDAEAALTGKVSCNNGAPSLASVTPSTGTILGGSSVTITGNNFCSGMVVDFGSLAAISLNVTSKTSAVAVTPANAAGVASVSAINPNGKSSTLANSYTYVAPILPLVASTTAALSGAVGQALVFNGGGTGGTPPYSYAWSFGDGGTASAASATHIYDAAGTYPATLTVTDSLGATANAQSTATIIPAASALVASAGGPYAASQNSSLTFSGSSSGGMPPYAFAWNFGDGTTGTGPSPVHSYVASGSYTVTLTVTDNSIPFQSTTAVATATVASSVSPGTSTPSSLASYPVFDFNQAKPNYTSADPLALPSSSLAVSYVADADNGIDNFDKWIWAATGANVEKYMPVTPSTGNSHFGYYSYGWMDIADQSMMLPPGGGNSLRYVVTGGYSDTCVYPAYCGLAVNNKTEYVAHMNDTYAPGVTGSPYMYFFGSNGTCNPNNPTPTTCPTIFPSGTDVNQLSFYVRNLDSNPVAQGDSVPRITIGIGTYSFFAPDGTPASATNYSTSGHFYNDMIGGAPGGGPRWLKVQVDTHPIWHNAQVTPPNIPDFIKGLFGFYVSLESVDKLASVPYSVYLAKFQGEMDPEPRNDETITGLTVGCNTTTMECELGFHDKYLLPTLNNFSSFEARYSFAPITNANYASATPVSVLPNTTFGIEGRTDGQFARTTPYNNVWCAFKLQNSTDEATLLQKKQIFFAVKDISQDPNNLRKINPALTGKLVGQGRDYDLYPTIFTDFLHDQAALPLIKRTDYILP